MDEAGFHLAAVSLETGVVLPLGLEGAYPRFVAPGYLVFARTDGALLAASFDARALRLTGAAHPIAEGVFVTMGRAAEVGVSNTGALAYVPESSDRALVIVDRAGRAESLPVPPQGFGEVRFSPEGGRIATTIVPPGGGEWPDIWVLDLLWNTLRRVTFDSGNVAPVWSPDGGRIAFASKPGARGFGLRIRRIAADHSDSGETLAAGDSRSGAEGSRTGR